MVSETASYLTGSSAEHTDAADVTDTSCSRDGGAMSHTSLVALAVAATVSYPALAAADPMTAGDRQRLVAHFEMTEAWLVSELDGLTDTQLAWRPAPDVWSVKDVVEHLGIAEPQYWQQMQDSLKTR